MQQLVFLITTKVYIQSNILRKAAEYTGYLAKTKCLVFHLNTCLLPLSSLWKG